MAYLSEKPISWFLDPSEHVNTDMHRSNPSNIQFPRVTSLPPLPFPGATPTSFAAKLTMPVETLTPTISTRVEEVALSSHRILLGRKLGKIWADFLVEHGKTLIPIAGVAVGTAILFANYQRNRKTKQPFSQLQTELVERNRENKGLIQALQVEKTFRKSLDEENAALLLAIETLKEDLISSNSELASVLASCNAAESGIQQLHEVHRKLDLEISSLHDINAEAQEQLLQHKDTIMEKDDVIFNLNHQIRALDNQMLDMKHQLQEKEEQIFELRASASVARQDKKGLREDNATLHSTVVEMNSRNKELDAENRSLAINHAAFPHDSLHVHQKTSDVKEELEATIRQSESKTLKLEEGLQISLHESAKAQARLSTIGIPKFPLESKLVGLKNDNHALFTRLAEVQNRTSKMQVPHAPSSNDRIDQLGEATVHSDFLASYEVDAVMAKLAQFDHPLVSGTSRGALFNLLMGTAELLISQDSAPHKTQVRPDELHGAKVPQHKLQESTIVDSVVAIDNQLEEDFVDPVASSIPETTNITGSQQSGIHDATTVEMAESDGQKDGHDCPAKNPHLAALNARLAEKRAKIAAYDLHRRMGKPLPDEPGECINPEDQGKQVTVEYASCH